MKDSRAGCKCCNKGTIDRYLPTYVSVLQFPMIYPLLLWLFFQLCFSVFSNFGFQFSPLFTFSHHLGGSPQECIDTVQLTKSETYEGFRSLAGLHCWAGSLLVCNFLIAGLAVQSVFSNWYLGHGLIAEGADGCLLPIGKL